MFRAKPAYILTPLIAVAFVAGFLAGPALTAPRALTFTKTYSTVYPVTVTATPPTVVQTAATTVTVTATSTVTHYPYRGVPLRLGVEESKLFEITFVDGYKVVRDALNRSLILVPRGMSPPAGADGVVIYVPVERVVLMSATHVALVERLRDRNPAVLDRIAGIMWGGQYEWYFQDVADRLARGVIRDVGPDWSPSIEDIIALKPDLVLIYAFPGSDLPARLDEHGIPYAVDNEYLETSVLGRFEWIKFIATFFDMDREAYEIYRAVAEDVERTIDYVASHDVARPLVCWFMVYRGTVYAAGGESFPANTLAKLMARYGFADTASTGSVTTNIEELLLRCRDADVVIYPTSFVSGIGDVLAEAPELADVKAFTTGRVYAYGANIYQLGYYDTEGLVQDLAAILYPQLFQGYELQYFVRLAG